MKCAKFPSKWGFKTFCNFSWAQVLKSEVIFRVGSSQSGKILCTEFSLNLQRSVPGIFCLPCTLILHPPSQTCALGDCPWYIPSMRSSVLWLPLEFAQRGWAGGRRKGRNIYSTGSFWPGYHESYIRLPKVPFWHQSQVTELSLLGFLNTTPTFWLSFY